MQAPPPPAGAWTDILVLCPERLVPAVQEALHGRAYCVTAWAEFESAAPTSSTMVVVEEQLGTAPWFEDLHILRGRLSHIPLVVATDSGAEGIDLAGRVGFDAFLAIDGLQSDLLEAAERAVATTPRSRLIHAIAHCPTLPVDLQTVLLEITRAHRPARTVGGAARSCGIKLSTLERHWNSWAADGGGPSLKEAVDGVFLLRASELAEAGIVCTEIARVLGVTLKTLRRKSKRVCGRNLQELRELGVEQFMLHVLDLLGIPGPTPSRASSR